MDYGSIYEISASGMDFQRLRMEVIAANIANAQTTSSNLGNVYQPLEAVAWQDTTMSVGVGDHAGDLLSGVQNQQVVTKDIPPRRVFDPDHPHADGDGYVYFPNIDMVDAMSSLMTASRAYEANVSVLNAAKSMALKALEIGK